MNIIFASLRISYTVNWQKSGDSNLSYDQFKTLFLMTGAVALFDQVFGIVLH